MNKIFEKYNNSTNEASNYRIVESFLTKGNLPLFVDGSKIDLRRITKNLIRRKDSSLAVLIRLRCRDKNFQSRLGNIISETFYKDLFALFTNRNIYREDSPLKQLLSLYRQFPFTDETIKSFRVLLFEAIIEVLSTESLAESFQLKISVFKILADKLNLSTSMLIYKSSDALKKMQSKQFSSELTTQLGLFLRQLETNVQSNEEIVKEFQSKHEPVSEIEYQNESHLIFNAGLVLLSPFLNTLFKKLDLIQEGNFINEQAQIKAIHLLQYAAIARIGYPEHLLILNKILCGFPINQAIPWHVKLSMKEKAETTRMITTTINNWSALKKTSTGTFRKAFILRKGILKKTKNGWKMAVEKTTDELPGMIPRQYKQIKLIWMTTKIELEW